MKRSILFTFHFHKRQAVAAVAAVETGGEGGKPPPEETAVAGGGPAATGDMDGYQIVARRRRGAQGPRAAKEAAGRAPAGRLRVQKGGKAAGGNRYGVVREKGGGGFRDCAACGEPAWGGRLCGAEGRVCANNAEVCRRRCEEQRRRRARARGRTGMSLAAAIMQRSVPRPERMRGEMFLHSGYAAQSASPAGEHAHTAHEHDGHALVLTHRPGDTCRPVPMGHRAFLVSGSMGHRAFPCCC